MRFLKKSLGQNLLTDKNIIRKIIKLVKIQNKNIIEIGPGRGALTEEIFIKNPKSFVGIEKDYNFNESLKEKYLKYKNTKFINEDILNFDIEKILKKDSIIFGNLPYNISSQILVKILKFKTWPPKFNDVIFMFQKELGDKIISKFPSPNYGRLSILTNYRLKIERSFFVSPNCFKPRPKVLSMVIHLRPRKNIHTQIKNIENLEKVTNIFFSSKRKMINKNLRKILSEQKIKMILNFDQNKRPSELSPEIYYKITKLFEMK